jgi:hypothetical protein
MFSAHGLCKQCVTVPYTKGFRNLKRYEIDTGRF